MTSEPFTLDANVLVYSVDPRDPAKARSAQTVIQTAMTLDCRLTTQAIGEFYAAATRRLRLPVDRCIDAARQWMSLFALTEGPARRGVERAFDAVAQGRLSYWDALLLATAEEAGCRIVISEDMGDGQRFGAIAVLNPFASDGGIAPAVRTLLGLDG